MNGAALARRRRVLQPASFLASYFLLLLASHLTRAPATSRALEYEPGEHAVYLSSVGKEESRSIRLVYRDLSPAAPGLPVVLLHGSPGGLQDFTGLASSLARERRVLLPDLPGFGASEHSIPDYSFRSHARYVDEWLDGLGVTRAHVVAFSMGGGVALHLHELDRDRVASLALVASVGVQDLELLGAYELNHAVHFVQLAGMWILHELVPHFGVLDGSDFGVPFARNFLDSDQRPLRHFLQSFEPPCLVVHGKKDLLVPYAAAIEHHRIVPQSELVTYETRGHFLLWQETESLSEVLREFFSEVDTGNARGRADAFSERVRSAEVPYEKTRTEPSQGLALIILLVIIVSGTWLSEDLTCLATGLLVARGRLTLSTGVLACSSGIVLGDLALYGLGRCLGRAALSRTPWRWFLRENSIRRAASWFERNGLSAVVLSRFLPGTRLPTFVAAGLVRTRLAPFALYLCLAAMVWTPLLVAGSAFASSEVLLVLRRADRTAPFLATVLLLWALLRLTVASGSTVRRRLWLGRIRRLTRWEFWPAQLFYVPVALYVLWLAIKHRSLKLVTAVNPGFPEGGFVGESKWEIFQGFSGEREHLAKTELLPAADLPPEKLRRIRNFVARESLVFPLVLKPDVGERGRGVSVVASLVEAERAVESLDRDYLVQEHVDGGEFGVFYVREPGMERGRIFSITRKILPELTGDGHSTLERLILEDERAVCGASAYLRANADRLDWVPARGERVRLVELGTHCRGAIFQDGADLRTPALEDAFDRISRALPGFFFGRYDLRAPSEERLRAGTGFKILELNGLTSEATHIYDPRNSPIDAYRVLFEQWRIAFRIAAENERRGVKPASLRNLLERFANYLKDPLRAM